MNIDKDNLEAIVQRYILDQLDEGDAEEFEAYFLCRPDVAEMVSSAQMLNLGLGLVKQDNSGAKSVPPQGSSEPWLSKLSRMFSGPAPTFAMAALLVCIAPFAIKGLSKSETSANVELVSLQSAVVRSASGSTKGLDLSVVDGQAAVIVRVRDVRYPRYYLSVRSAESEKEVWQSDEFEFASGSRDSLVLLPEHASIADAEVQLYGVVENGQDERVDFCNYTESCF